MANLFNLPNLVNLSNLINLMNPAVLVAHCSPRSLAITPVTLAPSFITHHLSHASWIHGIIIVSLIIIIVSLIIIMSPTSLVNPASLANVMSLVSPLSLVDIDGLIV